MAALVGSLLLPGTDRGVLLEALAAFAVLAVGLVLSWRDPQWRLVAFGAAVCVLAFFALRALH